MKVHELLATPDKWTRGCFARDKNDDPTSDASAEAVCFCLAGAIFRCYPTSESAEPIIAKVTSRLGGSSLSRWNDKPERTHAEVLALCKELDI